jgi:DNA-binding transcriptional regulator YiaG
MKCVMCGASTRPPRLERVPYRAAPHVTLDGVAVLACSNSDCGETYTEYPDLTGIESRVAEALAARGGRLDGQSVRFLRRWLGWSGQDMALHLSVQPETVSRWETDAVLMAVPTENLLRMCVMNKRHLGSEFELERTLALPNQATPEADVRIDMALPRPPANVSRRLSQRACHLALVA